MNTSSCARLSSVKFFVEHALSPTLVLQGYLVGLTICFSADIHTASPSAIQIDFNKDIVADHDAHHPVLSPRTTSLGLPLHSHICGISRRSSALVAARQRLLERTLFPDRLSPPIPAQQLLGSLGEHSANLPPFAFDPGDRHRLVGGGLVPHPCNDGGFGTLFDGDSLCPGDGAAADRRGVIGHRTGKPVGEVSVCRMEGQELQHRSVEVLDVFGLSLVPASGIGLFAFGVPLGGSLGFEFGTNLVDGRCRCPNAP